VDGQNYTAPQTFQWTAGSSHAIAVTSTAQAGTTGTQYVFANWSDSGAATHTVVASSSTPSYSYTATFTTQYQLTTTATAGGSISPVS
jgi:hypothetical protein